MICVIGLFIIINIELKDSAIFYILRKMSTIIYFIHMWIWTIYYTIIYHKPTSGLGCFLATTVCSVLISYVYTIHKQRNKIEKVKR